LHKDLETEPSFVCAAGADDGSAVSFLQEEPELGVHSLVSVWWWVIIPYYQTVLLENRKTTSAQLPPSAPTPAANEEIAHFSSCGTWRRFIDDSEITKRACQEQCDIKTFVTVVWFCSCVRERETHTHARTETGETQKERERDCGSFWGWIGFFFPKYW